MLYRKLISCFSTALFAFYSVWWVGLLFFSPPGSSMRDHYSDTYGVLAGIGGVAGLFISRRWGGLKSYVGKSVIFFSVGLLFQFLGQLSYTIEFYLYHIENSYPSWGEIFFVASIPAYILGVWYIAKAAGSSISLKRIKSKLGVVILPLLMMGVSYYLFIHGTDLSEMSFLEKFLFIFYPLGQATFVSFALLAYFLTGNVVGGVMRKRVFFILFSLVFQYIADSMFIYRTTQNIWYAADISEYMFVVSYFLMTIALIEFLTVFERLKKSENKQI